MTLSQLAARQFGVVSAGQLLRLGWTRKEIQGQVRRGSLHPLYREVYAVGHDRIVDHGRLLAALLSCGDGSFLSHRTAAAVWGLRPVNTRRVELTVPGINAPHRRGLVLHRSTDVAKDESRSRNGLRVSSVPRMLVELANSELQAELERLITEAVRRRLIAFPALDRAVHEHQRRPGMAKLKRALRDYRPRPDRKSDLERAFDRLIKDTDIPPPERNVYIGGWEIDCYWPEFKLVVELDGRNYHSSLADMERDRKKDADLLKLGIGTFRITDLRFELEPDQILADLRTLTT
jgi:very-short-patch-repair endonuclease